MIKKQILLTIFILLSFLLFSQDVEVESDGGFNMGGSG